jgi:glycolate oxidase
VLGCEFVLVNGDVIRLGGKHLDAGGYDLLGLLIGSEGLLGVVT